VICYRRSFSEGKGEPYDDVSWEFPANFHLAAVATADARFERGAYGAEGSARLAAMCRYWANFSAERYWAGEPVRGALPVHLLLWRSRERAFRVGGVEFLRALGFCRRRKAGGAVRSVASELGLTLLALLLLRTLRGMLLASAVGCGCLG